MSKVTIYITLATSIVAWLSLSAWTVRRLWRGWSTDYQRMVYRFGVRFFGIGSWILFGILLPLMQSDDVISPAFRRHDALHRVSHLLVGGLFLGPWNGKVLRFERLTGLPNKRLKLTARVD